MGRGILLLIRRGVLGVGIVAAVFWVAEWFCAWEVGGVFRYGQTFVVGSDRGELVILSCHLSRSTWSPPALWVHRAEWGPRLTSGLIVDAAGFEDRMHWWVLVVGAGAGFAVLRWCVPSARRQRGRGFPVMTQDGAPRRVAEGRRTH